MRYHVFCSWHLELDLMILIYGFDLKILKLYLRTENKLSRSRLSQVRALHIDRQTDRHMRQNSLLIYYAAVVKIIVV